MGGQGDKSKAWFARVNMESVTLVIFLTAGYYKADPRLQWLPLDLTVLAAALTVGLCGRALIRNRFRIHKNLVYLLLLFTSFGLPVLWTDLGGYPGEKVVKLFTLTLLAAVAPALLFKNGRDVRPLLVTMTLTGLIFGIDAAQTLVLQGGTLYRLTAFGSNTIALGRTTGMSLIIVALMVIEKRGPLWAAASGLVVLGVVLLGAGSRGPLLAALVSLLLTWGLYRRSQHFRFSKALVLLGAAMVVGIAVAPQFAADKVLNLIQGDVGSSGLQRLSAYRLSVSAFLGHPMGIGWGGFSTQIALWDAAVRQYPHNMIIEVFLEGGFLAGVVLTGLVAAAVRRISRYYTFEARAIFALLVFFFLNAMVSGDINDNKLFFAVLALALTYHDAEGIPPAHGRG